jgi:hypothetical protein
MVDEIKTNSEDIIKSFDSMYNKIGDIVDILETVAITAGALYAGGKLITGLKLASEIMDDLDGKTKGFTGTIKMLGTAIEKLPFARIALTAGVAMGAASEIFREELESIKKSMMSITPGWKDELEESTKTTIIAKEQIGEKTKEYNKLLSQQINLQRLLEIQTNTNKPVERIQQELKLVTDKINNAKLLAEEEKRNQEEAKKNYEIAKKTGELLQDRVVDKALDEELKKFIETNKEKTIELNETKKKFTEELEKKEKEYQETKNKTFQDDKVKATYLAKIEKEIKEYKNGVLLVDKQITEEKERQTKKSTQITETESQRAIKRNKELSEAKAIELELAMYKSGNIDLDRLAIELQDNKVRGLAEGLRYLEKGDEYNKKELEYIKEKLTLESMIKKEKEKALSFSTIKKQMFTSDGESNFSV